MAPTVSSVLTKLDLLMRRITSASRPLEAAYAHLAADHLAPYAERLCAARAMDNETVARFGHSPETAAACRRQDLETPASYYE